VKLNGFKVIVPNGALEAEYFWRDKMHV